MSNILMNRTRSRILRFLIRNGPSTCGQIGDELGQSYSGIRRQLDLLCDARLVTHSAGRFQASPERVQAAAASFRRTVMQSDLGGSMTYT
ncbi:helix-turn-helix domain-containing protein [Arthrobacter sp. Soil762]|uniref:helix-turn-helix domain-containing protein n=1 Tax=Arthrobacter sp. Soil762 TaxID=1736401 RepID=UPI0006FEA019|nr:hypothetical protein ASG77_08230 [Arthrobacter sp. Soil762]